MTFGLRCSEPACRPHPASLPVRVPTVESLLSASFSFTSRLRLAVRLRLPSSAPVGSFHPTRFCPCWAHKRNRFGDVVVHSGSEASLAVAGHGVGGHRDDRDVPARAFFLLPDERGGFKTIHLGHLHIHEDQVEGLFFQHSQSHPSVLGDRHAVPGLLQNPQGDALIDGVVLGKKNVE